MNGFDYSVFYYTYSTISQTLAGAFGFLVAVVLYRMQVSTADMPNLLRGWVQGGQAASQIPDMHERQTAVEAAGQPPNEEQERIARLKRGLKSSFRWSSGTIITSLIALPLTPAIAAFSIWADWVLVLGVTGSAIYTVMTYYGLSIDALRLADSPKGKDR